MPTAWDGFPLTPARKEAAKGYWKDLAESFKEPLNLQAPTEKDLYPFFLVILNIMVANGYTTWMETDQNQNHSETTTYPDLIVHSGLNTWNPKHKRDRDRVLLDVELKLHFHPKNVLGKSATYPGDAAIAYQQVLMRSSEAFNTGTRRSLYYAVACDFASITLYKIEDTPEKLQKYHVGPLNFGGIWNGLLGVEMFLVQTLIVSR